MSKPERTGYRPCEFGSAARLITPASRRREPGKANKRGLPEASVISGEFQLFPRCSHTNAGTRSPFTIAAGCHSTPKPLPASCSRRPRMWPYHLNSIRVCLRASRRAHYGRNKQNSLIDSTLFSADASLESQKKLCPH